MASSTSSTAAYRQATFYLQRVDDLVEEYDVQHWTEIDEAWTFIRDEWQSILRAWRVMRNDEHVQDPGLFFDFVNTFHPYLDRYGLHHLTPEWMQAAAGAAREMGDVSPGLIAEYHVNAGLAYSEFRQDHWGDEAADAALEQFRIARRLYEDVGDPFGAASTLLNATEVYKYLGDYATALEVYDDAERRMRDADGSVPPELSDILDASPASSPADASSPGAQDQSPEEDDRFRVQAWLHLVGGRAELDHILGHEYQEEDAFPDRPPTRSTDATDAHRRSSSSSNSSAVVTAADSDEEATAEELFRRAHRTYENMLRYARAHGAREKQAVVLSKLAETSLDLSRFEETIQYGEEALQLAETLRMETGVAPVLRAVGDARRLRTEWEASERAYSNARDAARRVGGQESGIGSQESGTRRDQANEHAALWGLALVYENASEPLADPAKANKYRQEAQKLEDEMEGRPGFDPAR